MTSAPASVGDAELVAQGSGRPPFVSSGASDVARARPLQGEHGDAARRVLELEPCEAAALAREVLPVLLPVGGVDDQQVLVLDEAVEVGVVDGAAGRRGDDRVLRLADVERGGVVGEDVLEERQGVGAAEDEAAHVGDVEEPGAAACRQVLGDDARRVLEGHLPAGEVDHLGPGATWRAKSGVRASPAVVTATAPSTQAFSLPRPFAIRSASMPE